MKIKELRSVLLLHAGIGRNTGEEEKKGDKLWRFGAGG